MLAAVSIPTTRNSAPPQLSSPSARPELSPASHPDAPPSQVVTVDRRWVIGVGAAAVTVAVGGALRWWWRARPHPNPSKLAIAVLPFNDISPGGLEQPIADGLAGEVIAVLTRHEQVRVSAPTSAFQFRHTALPLA